MDPQTPSSEIPPTPTKAKTIPTWLFGLLMLVVGLVAGLVVARLWLIPQTQTPIITPATQPPPPDQTTNWTAHTVTPNSFFGLVDYEIKLPTDWERIAHSSSFEGSEAFQASDRSSIRIMSFKNSAGSLADFLAQTDKQDATSWEGKASKKVITSKEVIVGTGQYSGIERTEYWLAAGFSTRVTYLAQGDVVVSIAVVPSDPLSPDPQIATRLYDQILSTFKFTNSPIKTENLDNLPTEKIVYKAVPMWKTWINQEAGFQIQYPAIKPEISVFKNYTGESRRAWLTRQFTSLYVPYYMNWVIDGKSALITIEGNPGGSSSLYVAIPNPPLMIIYTKSFVAWNPDTKELPDLTEVKQLFSTFKFL